MGSRSTQRGGNTPDPAGGGGVSSLPPTLPCSYLWKGEVSLSGTIMMLLSTAG